MMVKYAKMCEKLGVEMISVECELVSMSGQSTYWRKVVKAIKEVYSGKLTASANWGGEETGISWWNDVDYIGVDAYYGESLARPGSTVESMVNQ